MHTAVNRKNTGMKGRRKKKETMYFSPGKAASMAAEDASEREEEGAEKKVKREGGSAYSSKEPAKKIVHRRWHGRVGTKVSPFSKCHKRLERKYRNH